MFFFCAKFELYDDISDFAHKNKILYVIFSFLERWFKNCSSIEFTPYTRGIFSKMLTFDLGLLEPYGVNFPIFGGYVFFEGLQAKFRFFKFRHHSQATSI